ncbi:Aspartyl-tRNA(Asn) amidotransferase subunit A, Glutamyl-tRNA(Gln) amidotransferase subunit A [Klebsiella sp. PL-2018]|nr:Aspartyl-tRNA(Asn) amidotransferase subunit A, Glutamyl-tRNA(Gln) amidotransferase subunit A [Klebsiella sp. PL-2018]
MIKECIQMSAIEISRLIASRQISVYEAVSSHIDQAQRANANINAIIGPRYDEALAQAKEFDRVATIARDQPLFGVPFTVKESIAVQGLPNTYGSYYRRTDIANKHATAVERLLNAGAILIGQTNLSELALWPECANVIYGKTSNPYSPRHTSGGSSGGDAAIVSAGGVPFALGTDGGGSVRIPAAHCGVFGHKPSSKFVPMSGHFPLDRYCSQYPSSQFIARFFSMGPLCRKAEDLLPLLKIISGPDGIDKNINSNFDCNQQLDSLKGIKVYLLADKLHPLLKSVAPNVEQNLRSVASVLEKEGAEIIPCHLPFLADACELWFDIVLTAQDITLSSAVNEDRSLIAEMLYMISGKKRMMLSTLLLLFTEKIATLNKKSYIQFLYIKNKISLQLNAYLDNKSVLLLPTYPTTATKHNRSYISPFEFLYSALFNVLELPATSIPVSFSTDNFPVSIQIAGAHGYDHLPISLACYLEKILGGWKLPTMA